MSGSMVVMDAWMAMLGARDTVSRKTEWRFEWGSWAVTRVMRIFIKRWVFNETVHYIYVEVCSNTILCKS